MGNTNAWKELERGELKVEEFYKQFEKEVMQRNGAPIPKEFSPQKLLSVIASSLQFRSEMIDAIHTLKRNGLKVVALTNNWKPAANDLPSKFHHHGFVELFHHVFEVNDHSK